MPFDFIPENLDFNVRFEPTKVDDKKYVINAKTDEYIGVVGHTFSCASHDKFFNGVHDTITENLGNTESADMKTTWRSARKNAWALLDMTLPNVTARIETDKHSTTIAQRIIALHGIDGTCSNQVFFGAIDFFCPNGMIRGEHDKVRRKNSSLFSMDRFIRDLRESTQSFYAQSERLQSWARKPLVYTDVRNMLHTLMKSERVGDKMLGLYAEEAKTRGHNAWALYSAFTNFSSHANDNGFQLRNTGKDTAAVSMFNREHTVSQWIDSKPFKELLAA